MGDGNFNEDGEEGERVEAYREGDEIPQYIPRERQPGEDDAGDPEDDDRAHAPTYDPGAPSQFEQWKPVDNMGKPEVSGTGALY